MKRFLAIVGLILGSLLIVGLATYRHFVEPRHDGKSLSEWCTKPDAKAKAAIAAIGSRATYWMLAWAEPGGDPFREFRYYWNKFAPDKAKWDPPKDPRSMAAMLARLAPKEMRSAMPELVRRAKNADWNAVDLIKMLAPGDETVWIEILKSPDDQASGWAVEHFRRSPSNSEAFRRGLAEAYRTNREPGLGSELLLLRVRHGVAGYDTIGEIRRYLAGDPFLEPAYNAATTTVLLGAKGRPVLIEGMLSDARMTRDACTAAFRIAEFEKGEAPVRLSSREHLVGFTKGLDMDMARQDAAVLLLVDADPSVRAAGLKLLERSVSARVDKGVKPAIGSRQGFLKIEELSRSGDASLAKPLTELLNRVSVAEGSFNPVTIRTQ